MQVAAPSHDINKLVSLTFDENPEVRKKVANLLGDLDDPAAIFALAELSYDKDPSVREVALSKLQKTKHKEAEVMSFAEIFSTGSNQPPPKDEEAANAAKERVLRPISNLFERHLGKERAAAVKSKMMPTIERIYLKSVQHHDKKDSAESGRKAMQEFLTSYLEVMSDIDHIGSGRQNQQAEIQVTEQLRPEKEEKNELSGVLDEVGKSNEPVVISPEISDMELQETAETKEEVEIAKMPDTFFKKAYEIMMLSGGDEDIMKREMNRMLNDAKHDIFTAFKLAKKKFKELKITNITKIKDGMRNINTDVLTVKTIENTIYHKSKKHTGQLIRVIVNDETGNEGIVYLFDGRGVGLGPSTHIKIIRGQAKTFAKEGETVLVLGKKSSLYIVL